MYTFKMCTKKCVLESVFISVLLMRDTCLIRHKKRTIDEL